MKNYGCMRDEEKLLKEISMVDFVIVEMTEYLDTHPYDTQAIEYFNFYSRMKNQMLKEFAEKYWPLTLSTAENTGSEWAWGLQNPPWEGGK